MGDGYLQEHKQLWKATLLKNKSVTPETGKHVYSLEG